VTVPRVLVTGASKGIGAAIALELGRTGWNVAIHYGQDSEGAFRILSQLAENGGECYQADLRMAEEATALFGRVEVDGPLDAVVNNAGIYVPSSFLTEDDEAFQSDWQMTFQVNLLAPALISRSAAKLFSLRRAGKILNVASRVGFKGEAGAAIYAASKAGLINLTRSLAVELAPFNVGVFALAPGWVDTAMVREGMDERLAEIVGTLPLGRMATPQDCAFAASFLLSDRASYLSGQTIDINGASYFH
jgi:3-oxoacyl-[acyl-carrier protein] reductase